MLAVVLSDDMQSVAMLNVDLLSLYAKFVVILVSVILMSVIC